MAENPKRPLYSLTNFIEMEECVLCEPSNALE